MIVAMQEKATEEQIDAVIDAMVDAGVNVHRTTGAYQTILAGVDPPPTSSSENSSYCRACSTSTESPHPTNWLAAPFAPKAHKLSLPTA